MVYFNLKIDKKREKFINKNDINLRPLEEKSFQAAWLESLDQINKRISEVLK
jgi:hypothetical protein